MLSSQHMNQTDIQGPRRRIQQEKAQRTAGNHENPAPLLAFPRNCCHAPPAASPTWFPCSFCSVCVCTCMPPQLSAAERCVFSPGGTPVPPKFSRLCGKFVRPVLYSSAGSDARHGPPVQFTCLVMCAGACALPRICCPLPASCRNKAMGWPSNSAHLPSAKHTAQLLGCHQQLIHAFKFLLVCLRYQLCHPLSNRGMRVNGAPHFIHASNACRGEGAGGTRAARLVTQHL